MYSSMEASSSSESLHPWESKNLMPLYSAGLWEALITTPPEAPTLPMAKLTPGVGNTPTVRASAPADMSPAIVAASNMSPERRVSRPTTTRGRDTPRRTSHHTKARAR
ncbi:MAG: hypothetical protein BWY88_00844 [Synergistetes bacterium ADurb.Bin520]|nr:MAG: hypothetical protein BWY88_00844 [Synergistetes bacterium ADurb.Bin520]